MPIRILEDRIQPGTTPSIGYPDRYPKLDMPASALKPNVNVSNPTKVMTDPYKTNLFNQYQNITSQGEGDVNRANLTYADSPIFNQGLALYDPSSIGSKTLQNVSIPFKNYIEEIKNKINPEYDPGISYGGSGLMGTTTSAGFKQDLLDKINSGTATPEEKLEYSNTFGHEMSHLGWDYKPADERVTILGDSLDNLKTEGSKLSAKIAGAGSDYVGEEVWNRMHDLTYGSRGYTQEKFNSDFQNLKNQLASGEINFDQYKAEGKALIEKQKTLPSTASGEAPGEGYLKSKGYINKGDLSYTPKAFNEIAWSGLTTPSKQAIGFGINPFEDTKAAGQWYAQQKYKKMSKAKKQAQFQEIVRQGEAAEAAKKKAAADAAAAKQASLQARVTTQANREARERVSRGEARDYGKTETRASSGWQSSPFNRGGIVDLYKYGGFI